VQLLFFKQALAYWKCLPQIYCDRHFLLSEKIEKSLPVGWLWSLPPGYYQHRRQWRIKCFQYWYGRRGRAEIPGAEMNNVEGYTHTITAYYCTIFEISRNPSGEFRNEYGL
jgi:hypothetical protein